MFFKMAAALSYGSFASFGEKFSSSSDSLQDANTALAELDKGLRSSKTGEQCEAIVRFPGLFEKYPFPILINSALLKLADVFRVGNNFLRLCILKVTQQSEKHLDKVLNVDEFLKRIYSVIHSNDPVARAITVRFLGSIACLVSERKNVHHSIRSSLESHDEVELEAAIFATDKLCSHSREFASGLYNKLSQLIEGLSTPVEMKLKLIPIFRHMHYDLHLTEKVHELCSSLLISHPACNFVVVTLHTLSCLAVSCVIDIPKQAELLLRYLRNDPRRVAKNHALSDLRMLASGAPHMWKVEHVEDLCEFMLSCCYDFLTLSSMRVLVTLSRSEAVDILNNGKVLEVCCKESNSCNSAVAALATELLINIAVAAIRNDKEDVSLCEEALTAAETCAVVCCVGEQVQSLRVCLSAMNNLVDSYPVAAASLVETLTSLLPSSSGSVGLALCHTLVTIATQIPNVLQPLSEEIVSQFAKVIINADDNNTESKDLVVGIATLIFQSCQGALCYKEEREKIEDLLLEQLGKLMTSSRYWTMFRVGKQATRLGFHSLAAKMFGNLTSKVASEHFHFWLTALKLFCEAESLLSVKCDTQLALSRQICDAIAKYHKGITTLKASVSSNHQFSFQCRYTSLRAEVLQAHNLLLSSCATIKSCPPPAIARAVAMATGQDVQRLSHFTAQMSECSKLFRSLGERYGQLYQSSFNADPVSLQNIETLQQSCLLISHSINVLMKTSQPSSLRDQRSTSHKSNALGHSQITLASAEILETVESLANQLEALPVCHLQTDYLLRASMTILKVPFIYPKFFFCSQQATNIKLALSPSPRIPSEPISVTLDTQFVLKVEGVIEHGQHPGLYRKVQSVCLSVKWQAEDQKQQVSDIKSPSEIVTCLEQTVIPRHDYFSAQFLLSFNIPTLYHVTVYSSVIDRSGILWNTGSQSSLQVKASDSMARKQRTSRS
ncbi:integrator complex subunit 7-like isoform X1 [Acropora muricata]|uniref:integrator complex subunit 7-like isoform X1 n=1 Tax=Acropora muricata TaxID=159855 RepID=UPI0034E3C4F8